MKSRASPPRLDAHQRHPYRGPRQVRPCRHSGERHVVLKGPGPNASGYPETVQEARGDVPGGDQPSLDWHRFHPSFSTSPPAASSSGSYARKGGHWGPMPRQDVLHPADDRRPGEPGRARWVPWDGRRRLRPTRAPCAVVLAQHCRRPPRTRSSTESTLPCPPSLAGKHPAYLGHPLQAEEPRQGRRQVELALGGKRAMGDDPGEGLPPPVGDVELDPAGKDGVDDAERGRAERPAARRPPALGRGSRRHPGTLRVPALPGNESWLGKSRRGLSPFLPAHSKGADGGKEGRSRQGERSLGKEGHQRSSGGRTRVSSPASPSSPGRGRRSSSRSQSAAGGGGGG